MPTGRRPLACAALAVVLLAACSSGSKGTVTRSGASTAPSSATSAGGNTWKSSASSAPTGSSSSGGALPFTPEPVRWHDCSDGSGLDCADVTVPLDYADPAGPTLSIAVNRIRAADPSKRIGSLLVNPGGPGGSGTDFVKYGVAFDQSVLDRFDIVGFDPRGVGGSSTPDCATSTIEDLRAVDADPDTDAEQQQLDDAAKAVADDCAKHAGDLLPHIGTDDVVRDIDVLRQALGDDKLTYAGFSYGTLLGLRYLALFPTHARAIYIDGVVDPTQDFVGFLTQQTVAFEKRLGEIFADCPDGKSSCPDGGAQAAYDRIAATIESNPLPAGHGEVLDPTALSTAAIYSTYVPSFAATFYDALTAGLQGDGSRLRAMADAYWEEGGFASYAGVECIDYPHPVGAEAFKRFADDLKALSPRFGAPIANELLPCAFWPFPVHDVRGVVDAPDGPPTLVVGTTHDSATPYAQAVKVAHDLVHGRLLTYEGNGHTSYGDSTCVAGHVAEYLVSLTLPADGTTCTS